MSSAEGKEHLPDDNSLRSEFNFHNLDIGASLLKLRHLGLWDLKARSTTKATGPPKSLEYTIAYSTSQLADSDNWFYVDVEYEDAYPA